MITRSVGVHERRGGLQRDPRRPALHREDLDGIKIYLGEIGWVMVRASGTENLLRVYCETSNRETTARVLSGVTAIVRNL